MIPISLLVFVVVCLHPAADHGHGQGLHQALGVEDHTQTESAAYKAILTVCRVCVCVSPHIIVTAKHLLRHIGLCIGEELSP